MTAAPTRSPEQSPEGSEDVPLLTADRAPLPPDFEQGEPSTDIADLGLPPHLEAKLRGAGDA